MIVPIVLPARRKRGQRGVRKLLPGQLSALNKAVALGEVSPGDRVQYRTAKTLADAGLFTLDGDANDWRARITTLGRERLAEFERRAFYGRGQ